MTRINTVHPSRLSRQHLLAEYRELPRLFGAVKRAIERGERPDDPRNPTTYRLGPGHVRFFYPRLAYILNRYFLLCQECEERGFKIQFKDPSGLIQGIPEEWFGTWVPSEQDHALNIHRINERGGLLK